MICLFCTYEDLIYGDTNPSNQVLWWVLCEENIQVEELRVINKDQEGQPFKLGDVTPKITLHISNEYKNLSLGMPSHLTPTILISSKKPNYMAIKKALYRRQPGCFYLWFSSCPLAVTTDLVFSFVSEIFNKLPSFTYFGLKKLLFAFGDFIPARICARFDFLFLFCNSEWADIFNVTENFHPL